MPEACLPTAQYHSDGKGFKLEVPLPKTRAWAEADSLYSWRYTDTLLRYHEGHLMVSLEDLEQVVVVG